MITKEKLTEAIVELKSQYPNSRILIVNSNEKKNAQTNETFLNYYTKFNGAYYNVRFDYMFKHDKYKNMILVIDNYQFDRTKINGFNSLIIYDAKETFELEDLEENIENSINE